LIALSQNLAPSARDLLAVRIKRERHVDGLVLDQALVADLDPQGVEKHHRIDRVASNAWWPTRAGQQALSRPLGPVHDLVIDIDRDRWI
jgi:hypothetical protein